MLYINILTVLQSPEFTTALTATELSSLLTLSSLCDIMKHSATRNELLDGYFMKLFSRKP